LINPTPAFDLEKPLPPRPLRRTRCRNTFQGGLELPLKVVQARLGHASIQMTADTYGHLFPRGDDGSELAAAERAFLAG
jgi:integrase